ncbi:uncharacterized protein EHS24_005278 [Apiotrichum porosum]|uniref:BTB domain-containing protein n=1 Tax=Apiotrichum porosum TaxID=105984 RepID=A0A427XDE9_9TREE|nr:uncharacterized protein EHS24_005278 [Apiotrichum porosum]RSH76876.1 hypothetical protein EHS24_005278 [Apiotrichum porosum]
MAEGTQLTSWFETAKGEVPLPLTGPSLSLSPVQPSTVFLFGGKVVPIRRLTAEMWAFDLARRTWSRVNAGNGPGARYFHSMDVWEDKLVCFGGMSDADTLLVHNDVWMFDCQSRRWLPQPSPEAPLGTPTGLPPAVQDASIVPQARYAHLSSVSREQLVICGGQRSDNTWIYEMNIYDLARGVWTSKTEQPESHGLHSKGAYRSVAASSTQRVVMPTADAVTGAPALSYSVDEEGGGGDIWCYSNYDFAKVRRELEIVSPLDGAPDTPTLSDKFVSPPLFNMADVSGKMTGASQPPGLRFPAGGIIGNHFILCGLYLASTSAAFSIWVLDMTTLVWKHIEPQVLSSGSWNRAVLCTDTARLLVFGNSQSDLAADYGKRAVNLDHMAVIELEAYGIYRPPKAILSERNQDMGLTILEENLVCDFDIVCEDGRRIKCSRRLLMERWPWFAEQQAALIARAAAIVKEMPALDSNDAFLGSLSPARFTPDCLHIPEPLPVCVALVQYFYTYNLSTLVQTRAPVLSALLFLAKQYNMERLNQLVVHALHSRLEASTAVGVYEVATLAGERNLAARALQLIHMAKNGSSSRHHNRRPGSVMTNDGSQGSATQTPPPASHGSLPDASTQAAPSTTSHDSGDTAGNFRQTRVRCESLTIPVDDVVAGLEAELASAGRSRPDVDKLLDALDMSTAPPPSPIIRPVPSTLSPGAHSLSRSTSLSSVASARLRARPPLFPPPARPIPIRPVDGLLTPPALITPLTAETLRAASPTYSDATSTCPRTPSDSTRNSRDSTYLADSPVTPVLPERRPSFTGTPIKQCLPSLPEDEQLVDDASSSSFSSDMSDYGRNVPSVAVVVDDTAVDAPEIGGILLGQQSRALRALHPQGKLTRTASLNTLALRPRSSFDEYPVQARVGKRDGGLVTSTSTSSIDVLAVPPERLDSRSDDGITTTTTGTSFKGWASSTVTLVAAGAAAPGGAGGAYKPRPTSMMVKPANATTEADEHERLVKFQHFMAEQQRAAGIPSAEALAVAKRATGKAGQQKMTLKRLGQRLVGRDTWGSMDMV